MPDIWGPSHLSAHACTWKNMLSMTGDFCKPTMTPNIQATIILTTGLGPGQVDSPSGQVPFHSHLPDGQGMRQVICQLNH